MRFVADTHALVWYLQDHPRLSSSAKILFEQESRPKTVVVPTIVLAELLYISKKLLLSFKELLKRIEKDDRFEIFPLSIDVLHEAVTLNTLEIHDALIIATSLYLNIPLMTKDTEIIESKKVKVLSPI